MPSTAACESSDGKFLIQMLLLISSYKVNFRRNDIRELLFNCSVCDLFFQTLSFLEQLFRKTLCSSETARY